MSQITGTDCWDVQSRQSRGWAARLNWIRPGGPEDCPNQLRHQGNMFSPCGLSVRVGGRVWKGYFIPLFSSWGILGHLRIYLSCEEVLPKLSSSASVLGAVCSCVCHFCSPRDGVGIVGGPLGFLHFSPPVDARLSPLPLCPSTWHVLSSSKHLLNEWLDNSESTEQDEKSTVRLGGG